MENRDDLTLLSSEGVIGKYLCKETNEIIEAIGTVAVPNTERDVKYRGTIIWSQDISLTEQVLIMKKICEAYNIIPNKNILYIARENPRWTFGEFYGVDAVNIMEISKNNNLNIEMTDTETQEELDYKI